MNTKNDSYNIYLCELQGRIFYLASFLEYDLPTLIKVYMKSRIAKMMDNEYSSIQGRSPASLLDIFILENKKELKKQSVKYNPDAAEWLGYFYKYWQLNTKEPSSKIVGKLKPIDGLKKYFNFHQMDFVQAIDLCKKEYNLKRNAHRKYEIKKNQVKNSEILNQNSKESFAKTLLIKAYGSEIFKDLTEDYSSKTRYDLISINLEVGVDIKVVNKFDNNQLLNLYLSENEEMLYSKICADNSILFIFVTSSDYDEIYINRELINLYNEYLNKRSKFDTLFIYIDSVLYEINKPLGISKIYLGTTLNKVNKQEKWSKLLL